MSENISEDSQNETICVLLSQSHTFIAPSIPYPTTVGPNPLNKVLGPSFFTMSTAAESMPLL